MCGMQLRDGKGMMVMPCEHARTGQAARKTMQETLAAKARPCVELHPSHQYLGRKRATHVHCLRGQGLNAGPCHIANQSA